MIIMMPIGPLMREHRLIERMIHLFEEELKNITTQNKVNLNFIENGIDFIRTYADRCHHGKEEDILFINLKNKNLSSKDKQLLDELLQEHKIARNIVSKLINAKDSYKTEKIYSKEAIVENIEKLINLYPNHIEKEDKIFFINSMNYLDKKEQEEMLDKFWDFDKQLIHEKYQNLVESFEK